MKFFFALITRCLVSSPPYGPKAGLCDTVLSDDQKKTIVYGMYENYKKEFPSVKDITAPEAMALMKKEAVLFVDTRKQAEMAVSMIPGAITKQAFLDHQELYRSRTVIVYCTISYRSGKFAVEMEKKGVQIFNLKGGILAWVLEGGKVHDEKGETRWVHVYGKEWNYPPEGYQPVMFGVLNGLLP